MLNKLFKQSGIYFFGLVLSKILSVVVFILFARTLLPAKFGDFVLFVTLLQIVTFFADFGLNQWYQKQADQIDKRILFNKVISSRTITLIVSLIISYIFLKFTNSFSSSISLIFLINLLTEAFLSIADGYYFEKGESVKISLKTGLRMGILFLGYIFLKSTFSLTLALQTYLIASFITLFWFFPWRELTEFNLESLSHIFTTLKNSSAYAFLIFSSFLYARGDSLVIRYLLNSTALGIYGGAYRYLESLSLLPTALSHNLFPISAKKNGVRIESLRRILFVTLLSGIIISFAVFIFSDVLIVALLGTSYIQAIPILKIFSAVLFLFFVNSPLSTVVQSSHFVKKFLPYGFVNTLLNIVLNLIFIPIFGIVAAAWIMLVTEITGLTINIYFVKKLYR